MRGQVDCESEYPFVGLVVSQEVNIHSPVGLHGNIVDAIEEYEEEE